MVGSVVLPVLGAVPDGAIVLVAGLGDRAEAAKEIKIGVGALAGSTILLLTVPWFLAIFGGRVTLRDGACVGYDQRPRCRGRGLTSTGVECLPALRETTVIMLVSTMLYFTIQIPAFVSFGESAHQIERFERPFAAVGAGCCFVFFLFYLGSTLS